ncbi:MAG: SAM-dependent methyltransferase [Alphaproteobacteria bacterium]
MILKLSGTRGLKFRSLPLILTVFRIFGRRWNHFYAWMLDRQERHNTIEKIIAGSPQYTGKEKGLYDLSVAQFHLPLLELCGMTPQSRVLDFGCGFGRSAVHLVPFLEPGNYVGIDLSAERIRLAGDYMERENLTDRGAVFHTARSDNSLAFLGHGSFDMVWARAVLVHMPLAEMRECLTEIHNALKDGGVFVGDVGLTRSGTVKTSVKDFWVEEPIIRKMVEEVGFSYDQVEDWQIGIAPEHQRPSDQYIMLRLTKKR